MSDVFWDGASIGYLHFFLAVTWGAQGEGGGNIKILSQRGHVTYLQLGLDLSSATLTFVYFYSSFFSLQGAFLGVFQKVLENPQVWYPTKGHDICSSSVISSPILTHILGSRRLFKAHFRSFLKIFIESRTGSQRFNLHRLNLLLHMLHVILVL